jgi:anaerobic ribonucleoside-triphosphate reductase activating protein
MNINSIQFPVFKPYDKAAIEIYIAGCDRGCPGCCNPELQDFNHGSPIVIKEIIDYLKERESLFEVISIVGGDLLCQPAREARQFIDALKQAFPNKVLWLFTGAEMKDMLPWVYWKFDYIKYGPYKQELKQEGFPASTNQKVWSRCLPKSPETTILPPKNAL